MPPAPPLRLPMTTAPVAARMADGSPAQLRCQRLAGRSGADTQRATPRLQTNCRAPGLTAACEFPSDPRPSLVSPGGRFHTHPLSPFTRGCSRQARATWPVGPENGACACQLPTLPPSSLGVWVSGAHNTRARPLLPGPGPPQPWPCDVWPGPRKSPPPPLPPRSAPRRPGRRVLSTGGADPALPSPHGRDSRGRRGSGRAGTRRRRGAAGGGSSCGREAGSAALLPQRPLSWRFVGSECTGNRAGLDAPQARAARQPRPARPLPAPAASAARVTSTPPPPACGLRCGEDCYLGPTSVPLSHIPTRRFS
ncbi:uncharacterized protein LOC144340013 [Macaca mulatta]